MLKGIHNPATSNNKATAQTGFRYEVYIKESFWTYFHKIWTIKIFFIKFFFVTRKLRVTFEFLKITT